MTRTAPIGQWVHSPWKRLFDFVCAAVLLIPALPLMLLVAIIVKATSRGPVLFSQTRPGRLGKQFRILKFRTMRDNRSENGPMLTRCGDPRLTWIGAKLRKYKVDELPQLFNVLLGQMSFVGPRPQPAKLWNHFHELPPVLKVRPGITGAATLAFRHEEELLEPLTAEQVEEFYINALMPLKLRLDLQYLARATFFTDLGLILRTVGCLTRHATMDRSLRIMVELLANGRLDQTLVEGKQCIFVGAHSVELLCDYLSWKHLTAEVGALVVPEWLVGQSGSTVSRIAVSELPAFLASTNEASVFILPDVAPHDINKVLRACAPAAVPVYNISAGLRPIDRQYVWAPSTLSDGPAVAGED